METTAQIQLVLAKPLLAVVEELEMLAQEIVVVLVAVALELVAVALVHQVKAMLVVLEMDKMALLELELVVAEQVA
jgi:hypothetical protein